MIYLSYRLRRLVSLRSLGVVRDKTCSCRVDAAIDISAVRSETCILLTLPAKADTVLLADFGTYELKLWPDGKYEDHVLEFFCCSVSSFGGAPPFLEEVRPRDGTYELQVLF